MKRLLALPVFLLLVVAVNAANVVERLQEVSVTVHVDGGMFGSGWVQEDRERSQYVMTAGHVAAKLKNADGSWKPARVVQIIRSGDEDTGSINVEADVIACSPSDKEDLAVLKVRGKPFKRFATFHTGADIPYRPGERLLHVGTLGDPALAASVTDGIVSYVGRRHPATGTLFDQGTFPAVGGSSGGLVATADGVVVGLITQGPADTVNLFRPARSIRRWLRSEGLEYVLDPRLSPPEMLPAPQQK